MLGFTKQEQGIVLFLIFSFLVGASVQLYNRFFRETSVVEVNQEIIDEFNVKSQKINSELFREPGSGLKQENIISKNNRPASKKTLVKKKTNIQTVSEDDASKFALIDINLANADELQLIPRIGPVLAQRIIQYRQENGQFRRVEELKQIKGIGKATFEKISPYISINIDGTDSN